MDLLTSKEISQQCTPATHTEAVHCQRVLLGVIHSCLWPLKAPGSTFWGRVAKPLVSSLTPVLLTALADVKHYKRAAATTKKSHWIRCCSAAMPSWSSRLRSRLCLSTSASMCENACWPIDTDVPSMSLMLLSSSAAAPPSQSDGSSDVPVHIVKQLCGRPPQYAPAPCKLTLTFWPWKWCPSHVWRGLPRCQF